ncbi:WD40 repeat-like protein [Ramaria rubella]|nr:WD40 repeat-like protein [Ramaria rubella]
MLSYLPTLPSRHRYTLVATLKGHQDAINSLALSTTGNVLASGAGDSVKLWDIQSKTQLIAPKQNLLARGPVSCLTWINHRDDPNEHLCYGTALGYLVICAQNSRDGNFEEITAKPRIAIATRDSMVQVWKVDARGTLHSVFSVQLNGTVPRAVGFADAFNKDTPNKEFLNKDILVFGLFDSNMHVLRGEDGKVMVTHELGSRIGSAAISNKQNQCVIDNTADGFDLYWLGNGAYIRTFNTGKPRQNMPKQVTFGEDGKAIVGGNDHGIAYIFDQVKGMNLDVLQHAKKGLVQTITTHDRNGVSMIMTASSDASNDIYMCIWKYARDDETSERRVKEAWSLTFLGRCLIKLLVLGAAIMFVYQNTSLMVRNPFY